MKRRIALDTDVLATAHCPALPHHAPLRRFVQRLLDDPDLTIVLSPVVVNEFLHLVTDAKRFDPPVEMAEALAVVDDYLQRPNVECSTLDGSTVTSAMERMRRHALGRKRVSDTFIAEGLMEAGVDVLFTLNTADFALFDDALVVIHPLRG